MTQTPYKLKQNLKKKIVWITQFTNKGKKERTSIDYSVEIRL